MSKTNKDEDDKKVAKSDDDTQAPTDPAERPTAEHADPAPSPVATSPTPEPTTGVESAATPAPVPATVPSPLPILRMRQPFKILIDIWGVITSYAFRDELFAYIDQNLKPYLVANIEKEDVKKWLEELVKQTAEDQQKHPQMPQVVATQLDHQEVMINAAVANVNYRQANDLMAGLDNIFNMIWNDGYRRRTLQPHLFPDVVDAFRRWAGPPYQIKIYTFASGPWEVQKLFLGATAAGTALTENIVSGFNAFHQFKYQAIRYRQVVVTLGERQPMNLFYLTDSPRKAAEARKAGLTVFVVRREGNGSYRQEMLDRFTLIYSLAQFDFFEFAHPEKSWTH